MALACRFAPGEVLPFLRAAEGYPAQRCLAAVSAAGLAPAAAFLLERQGAPAEALRVILGDLRARLAALRAALAAGAGADADADAGAWAVADARRALDHAVGLAAALCERAGARGARRGAAEARAAEGNGEGEGGREGGGREEGGGGAEALWLAVLDVFVSEALDGDPAPAGGGGAGEVLVEAVAAQIRRVVAAILGTVDPAPAPPRPRAPAPPRPRAPAPPRPRAPAPPPPAPPHLGLDAACPISTG